MQPPLLLQVLIPVVTLRLKRLKATLDEGFESDLLDRAQYMLEVCDILLVIYIVHELVVCGSLLPQGLIIVRRLQSVQKEGCHIEHMTRALYLFEAGESPGAILEKQPIVGCSVSQGESTRSGLAVEIEQKARGRRVR